MTEKFKVKAHFSSGSSIYVFHEYINMRLTMITVNDVPSQAELSVTWFSKMTYYIKNKHGFTLN